MRRTVLLSVLFMASLLPLRGDARTIARGSLDGPGNPAIHLPLDSADETRLILTARGMPAVQTAIDACLARGYVRHPEADRAVAPELGRSAVCFLGFEKPGYIPPLQSLGAPVILVATIRAADGLTTRISSGFVILDGNLGSWRVYDPEVGGYGGTGTSMIDAPFDVEPDRMLELDTEQRAVLASYAVCAGFGNSACVLTGIGAGLVGTPVVGIVTGLACIATTTGQCLGRAIMDWPHR